MARLTWDQVTAPDFRGVLDGYQAASKLIGNAVTAAQGGLDRAQADQTNAADNAVMADLLRYQGNPDALTGDLGSGAFQGRHDMSKISAAMREHLSKAPTELLKFAGDKSKFDEGQKIIGDQNYIRENREVANAVVEATMQGDKQRLAALKQARPDFFQRVNTDSLVGMYKQGFGLQTDDLGNQRSGFELGSDVEDRADNAAADTMYQEAVRTDEGEAYFNNNREALINTHGQRAYNKAIARFQNGGDPVASFFGGSAPGAGGPGAAFNAGAITAAPDDASSLIEAAKQLGTTPEDLATVISYETGGKFDPNIRGGKNNNHVGLIQFGKEEQAKYGIKPGMSIKDQMPAVVQYLKDRGFKPGMALVDLYSTINGGKPGLRTASDGNGTIESHVAKMSAEHRANAAKFLGVADPRRAQVAVNTALAQGANEDPNRQVLLDFADASQSRATVTDVANNLTKEGGAFAGGKPAYVEKLLSKIMDMGVNAEVAGKILGRNKSGEEGFWTAMVDGSLNPFSDGLPQDYNWDGIKNDVALAKDRKGLQAAALAESDRQTAASNFASANQTVAQVEQAYERAKMNALFTGREVNHDRWAKLITAARTQQRAAGEFGATTAQANTPPSQGGGGNRTHNPPPTQQVAPEEPLPVRQARGILKLNGKVGEKQAATFKATYGVTPQEAIANPSALPKTGRSVTTALGGAPSVTRGQLIIDANAALMQGAAAIAAFQAKYGQHPRAFAGM